ARGWCWLGENEEGLVASAATDELETVAQLIHLGFTAPRLDPEAFAAWKLGQKAFLTHRDVVPETVFDDALTAVMTKAHPRRKPETAADVDGIDLDRALAIYRDR